MWSKIVVELNTKFPAVKAVRFGDKPLPAPPYCVVKQESDGAGRGTAFRIIAHFKPGQQIFLQDYIRGTVITTLRGYQATNRHGNINKLNYDGQPPVDITTSNDDESISMEALFWMPDGA